MSITSSIAKGLLRAPVLLYRYGISPFLPGACRHLPSCSEYTSDAIDLNGAWKGSWLAFSRILRCNPWGSHGLDPVPDLRTVHQPFYAPWRYGRWSGSHITERFNEEKLDKKREKPCDH